MTLRKTKILTATIAALLACSPAYAAPALNYNRVIAKSQRLFKKSGYKVVAKTGTITKNLSSGKSFSVTKSSSKKRMYVSFFLLSLLSDMLKKNRGERMDIANIFYEAAVGDALGVPYEFRTREQMKERPCTDMRGGGSHLMPKGVWSDDTAMLLATADGMYKGISQIKKNYMKWLFLGCYAPFHLVYDVGVTTRQAILRMPFKKLPGIDRENANGNGSLMRILPMAIYLLDEDDIKKRRKAIYEVSALTHAHKVSCEGCFLYCEMARLLLKGKSKEKAYLESCDSAINAYKRYSSGKILLLKEDDISSSGYVVDTLEAAVWCLLTSDSYEETVLKAVNLGKDTDTVACVAGGLAGIIYPVPERWKRQLKKRKLLERIAEKISVKDSFMREATHEEQESVERYVESISKNTGIRFFDDEKKNQ